jgi:hypothetical protein
VLPSSALFQADPLPLSDIIEGVTRKGRLAFQMEECIFIQCKNMLIEGSSVKINTANEKQTKIMLL